MFAPIFFLARNDKEFIDNLIARIIIYGDYTFGDYYTGASES